MRPRLLLALVGLVPLVTPAAARASYALKETVVTVSLGHTHRGIGVVAQFTGCNTSTPRYDITYTKQYQGAFASVTLAEGQLVWTACTVSGNLKSGSVYADLRKKGKINGKLAKAGKSTHGHLDPGCTGTVTNEPMKFTGKAVLTFDRTKLGTVNLTNASAHVRRTNESCNVSGASPTLLAASIGKIYVQGLKSPTTRTHATFSEQQTKVGTNIYAADLVELTGKHVFSAASDLSSAAIHGKTPAVGTLNFTANPACSGDPNGRTGKLTGSVTVHFLFGGTIVVNGPSASNVALTRGASPCGT